MLRPHCKDVSNKGLIKSIKAASILLQIKDLSEPKFGKIWQILPKIALTLPIGENSIFPDS